LSFQLKSMERNPELAGVVEGNEMVLLVRVDLEMNDVSGAMHLGLPAVVMEPALHRSSANTAGDRPDAPTIAPATARPALERSLEACAVQMDVDLAEVEVSLADLLQLRSGDVLTFAPNTESGATASLEGVACLEGKPGRSRGHWAFQVISKVLDGARAEGNPA
jgi:flagellar motor switch protein FliM